MPEENKKSTDMTDIDQPGDNDVPFGRGGFTNHHPGHKRYLKVVQDHQLEYIKARKCDKAKIAWKIIHMLRAESPPVRFLQKDSSTGLWNDVGDRKAREKTSQALREHQPFIKAVVQMDEEGEMPPLRALEKAPEQAEPSMGTAKAGLLLPSNPRKRFSGLHESFLASRNEVPMQDLIMVDEPLICGSLRQLEGSGMSLSDFSVSQSPSFRFNSSRMGSGKWEELLEDISGQPSGELGAQTVFGRSARQSSRDLEFPSYVEDLRSENEFLVELDQELGNRKLWEELTSFSDILPANPSRPGIVKRGTSNQNETIETKTTSVKRCLLSRDKSEISNKLKQEYLPDYYGNDSSTEFSYNMLNVGKALEDSSML